MLAASSSSFPFLFHLLLCSLHAYPPCLPLCVTVYLRHRPSVTVSNTRTCIPHSPHNHTYYKYHSTRFLVLSFIFFYSPCIPLVFALPASTRAYLTTFAFQFVELDTFPLDSFSFLFLFSWSRESLMTVAYHRIASYHIIIRPLPRRSFVLYSFCSLVLEASLWHTIS